MRSRRPRRPSCRRSRTGAPSGPGGASWLCSSRCRARARPGLPRPSSSLAARRRARGCRGLRRGKHGNAADHLGRERQRAGPDRRVAPRPSSHPARGSCTRAAQRCSALRGAVRRASPPHADNARARRGRMTPATIRKRAGIHWIEDRRGHSSHGHDYQRQGHVRRGHRKAYLGRALTDEEFATTSAAFAAAHAITSSAASAACPRSQRPPRPTRTSTGTCAAPSRASPGGRPHPGPGEQQVAHVPRATWLSCWAAS